MIVNAEKLDAELRAAGVPIHGCDSSGGIQFRDEATQAQRDQAAALLAAHDPAPTLRQRLRAKGISYREAAIVRVLRKGALAEQWAKDEVARLEREVDSA